MSSKVWRGISWRSKRLRRAIEVGLRELEVGLALADGRRRDVERRLRLLDLLEDFAVLDLGERLAAC